MLKANPCTRCGACCAFFRVAFLLDGDGDTPVPLEFTEGIDESRRCMQGTNKKDPRCVCLKGEIGAEVKCGIYDRRPGPCRRFGIQWRDGEARISERDFIHCNRARQRWNLSRLSRKRATVIPPEPASENPKDMP
jgi:hypothetical protein